MSPVAPDYSCVLHARINSLVCSSSYGFTLASSINIGLLRPRTINIEDRQPAFERSRIAYIDIPDRKNAVFRDDSG